MSHNSVTSFPCDMPTVGVCADCSTTIWSHSRRECCGEFFSGLCFDAHVAHVCLRKPVETEHLDRQLSEAA